MRSPGNSGMNIVHGLCIIGMNNVQETRSAPRPREAQRERLIACAEAKIATGGLAALRVRELAACAGCSLGGLYNLVDDLDELVLLVGQRTMAGLDAALAAADAGMGDDSEDTLGADALRARLLAWVRAYAAFAAAHRERWRALFEFRMAKPREFPDWFAADQLRVFERLERRLAPVLPGAEADRLRARARALFAAVHGIVALGLDEKLVGLAPAALDAELEAFVKIYVDGLVRGAQGLSGSQTSVASL